MGCDPTRRTRRRFSSASGRSRNVLTTANVQPWRCNAAGVDYGPRTAKTTRTHGGHGSGTHLATSSPATSALSWRASKRRAVAETWRKRPFDCGLSATTRALTGSEPRLNGGDASTGRQTPTQSMRPVCQCQRTSCCPSFLLPAAQSIQGKTYWATLLCSSYEAFRNTREQRTPARDDHDNEPDSVDLTHSSWYLWEFDAALTRCTGKVHPKIASTVRKVVDLWEAGEKVLVFAFYRQTCAALRIHISEEIRQRTTELARQRLTALGRYIEGEEVDQVLGRIQDRFFDAPDVPGRRALDLALRSIVDRRRDDLMASGVQEHGLAQVVDVMRRFLRVPTTLVRCFPPR